MNKSDQQRLAEIEGTDWKAEASNHRVTLKSGDYNSVEIMQAWCFLVYEAESITDLLDIVKRQQEQLAAAEKVIGSAQVCKINLDEFGDTDIADTAAWDSLCEALAAYRKQYPEKDDAQG